MNCSEMCSCGWCFHGNLAALWLKINFKCLQEWMDVDALKVGMQWKPGVCNKWANTICYLTWNPMRNFLTVFLNYFGVKFLLAHPNEANHFDSNLWDLCLYVLMNWTVSTCEVGDETQHVSDDSLCSLHNFLLFSSCSAIW